VSRVSSALAALLLAGGLFLLIGWPLLATVIEASHLAGKGPEPATGGMIDPVGTAAMLRETGGLARPARLAVETLRLVAATELLALGVGIPLALLLFRTDVWGRNLLLLILVIAAFIPLPLHATAWLGALGNAGRMQAIGVRPILVGRTGAAIIHALAALPWVVLLAGVGFRTVEPELEESAALDLPPWRVLSRITLRRGLGVIAAVAVAVAVLTAGDMTVTDLLLVRTYAEEAFVQFTLGRGPADAAIVSIPPLLVLSAALLLLARAVRGADPARLASAFARARRWEFGAWRILAGWAVVVVVGNFLAFPLYSLIWRAGRVGGRAGLGRPPSWSLGGLLGTLQFAASEIREPILTSLVLAAIAATVTTTLAWALAWKSRRRGPWQVVALGCLALMLASPGPVAGMAMELAYLRIPSIYDSWIIVAMAQSMRTLPYALLILWPALRVLPRELLESASVDGRGDWGVVRSVALPLSAQAMLAAWAVTFILGFGELPATNLLQPPGVTTITFRIWTLLHTGVESHLAGVALVTLAVIAILVVFMILAVGATLRWGRSADSP
jgi:iron(III) transport system permease protein